MMISFKSGDRLGFFKIFNLLIESTNNQNFDNNDLKLWTYLEVYFLIYEIHSSGLGKE